MGVMIGGGSSLPGNLKLLPQQLVNSSVSAPTTETDMINISGPGLLNEVHITGGSTNQTTLRVYIDGVLKFAAKNSPGGNNNFTGITQRFLTYYNSGLKSAVVSPLLIPPCIMDTSNGFVYQYPYTGLSYGCFCVMSSPIPFKSSLRITVQTATASETIKIFADYNVVG